MLVSFQCLRNGASIGGSKGFLWNLLYGEMIQFHAHVSRWNHQLGHIYLSPTLKLTKAPLKIGAFPKGKACIPTYIFQGRESWAMKKTVGWVI